MEHRVTFSYLESLIDRLAVVNARMHCVTDENANLTEERREIMELISRERLGQSSQLVWKPGDRYTA